MESDLSLINKIKDSQDSNCLTELISRHSGIYIYIVDQFTKNEQVSSCRDSILEDKDFIIYKSAINYNPEKNSKFSTYLANQTKWKCLNALKKARNKKEVSLEQAFKKPSEDDSSIDQISKIEALALFQSMLEKENDKRIKKIIDIRYNTSNNKLTPWRTAAKKLNMSIQGCINIHNRFIKKVNKEFEKNYV